MKMSEELENIEDLYLEYYPAEEEVEDIESESLLDEEEEDEEEIYSDAIKPEQPVREKKLAGMLPVHAAQARNIRNAACQKGISDLTLMEKGVRSYFDFFDFSGQRMSCKPDEFLGRVRTSGIQRRTVRIER